MSSSTRSRPSRPLLSSAGMEMLPVPTVSHSFPTVGDDDYDDDGQVKSHAWWVYLPTVAIVILLLLPHPSLLIVLVSYHLKTLHSPLQFMTHLLTTYALTFLAFSSLIVCVTRDPGSVIPPGTDDDHMTTTLMSPADDDFLAPGKWCRKCWAPKYERTHHCSRCGRCVLKMDHHCPWMASKCIGYNTYPSFIHFLICVTLLALNIAIVSIHGLIFAFNNPYSVDERIPVHELFLAFDGLVFALVMGSFLGYHIYLISTNQTTIENLSEFILLRHLPPLPDMRDTTNGLGHSNPHLDISSSPPPQSVTSARVGEPYRSSTLSEPPLEHELSYRQRSMVRETHRQLHLYDMGWRRNWSQVFGRATGRSPYPAATASSRHWLSRLILNGGDSPGDGKSFPRNSRADDVLARLARELVVLEKDR